MEPGPAQQLSAQHRNQEAHHAAIGRTSGGQPAADVDVRKVLLRGHQNFVQEEAAHFLHDQVDRAPHLLRQGGELGAVPAVAGAAVRRGARTSDPRLRQDADRPLRRRQNARHQLPGHGQTQSGHPLQQGEQQRVSRHRERLAAVSNVAKSRFRLVSLPAFVFCDVARGTRSVDTDLLKL